MLKVFSIGKAKAEIERLNAEVARLTSDLQVHTENAELIAKAAEENVAALTAANEKLSKTEAELVQSKANEATAKLSIESLTKERDALAAKISDPKGKVASEAARVALEIVAGQGVAAPLAVSPDSITSQEPLTFAEKAIAAAKAKAEARSQK